MREPFAARLACPTCGSPVRVVGDERVGGEIVRGRVACAACGSEYPIRGGIPRMVVGESLVRGTQRSFGSQWTKRAEGRFEDATLWGMTPAEEQRLFFESLDLRPEDLRGRWVLDAGCGAGRLTCGLARLGANVVGLDVADSIDYVARQGADLETLHLVQGNLLHVPLAEGAFDYVWSSGVIHHTGDTPAAFANLARVVRPGGRLYVWVYSARKITLYKYIRDAMRISPKLPPNVLFYLCYAMAPPLKAYQAAKLALRRVRRRPITPRDRTEARLRTIAFELHDDLSPPFQT